MESRPYKLQSSNIVSKLNLSLHVRVTVLSYFPHKRGLHKPSAEKSPAFPEQNNNHNNENNNNNNNISFYTLQSASRIQIKIIH